MARIYRSLDRPPDGVQDLDLLQRRLVAPPSTRPTGGFHGVSPGQSSPPRPLSQMERRQLEARRLLEDAQKQAETIQRDAYHAGFEEGERAGLKLAMQKIEPALQTLSDMIRQVSEQREALIRQHESELIKVSFLIAQQVVHTTIQIEPRVCSEVVASALEKVAKNQTVTLLVSPQDLTLVQQNLACARAGFLSGDHVKIQADEAIGRGGCRVVTDTGDIDATIETQMRVLQNVLW